MINEQVNNDIAGRSLEDYTHILIESIMFRFVSDLRLEF